MESRRQIPLWLKPVYRSQMLDTIIMAHSLRLEVFNKRREKLRLLKAGRFVVQTSQTPIRYLKPEDEK